MKPYVASDRLRPWKRSWFVLHRDRLVARGLTWPQALKLARALSA